MKTQTNLFLAACLSSGLSQAAIVIADFDDLNTGNPNVANAANQPAGSGTGFSQTYWSSGTSTLRIDAGGLTAPVSTGYAIASSGSNPGRMSMGVNSSDRQQDRLIADPLQGTVWFSYLFNTMAEGNTTGISLSPSTSNTFSFAANDPGRVYAQDNDLYIRNQLGLADAFIYGRTHLIVGRLDILGGTTTGNDALSIWIDPDVTGGTAGLGGAAFSSANIDFLGTGTQINKLGVQFGDLASPDSNVRGSVDSIRLSDTETAFADVTSIPEPSSTVLLVLGGLFLARRKRA